MKISEEILDIIYDEQNRQNNRFVPNCVDYLNKISECAELIVHQEKGKPLGFVFFYCNAKDKVASYITLIATAQSARNKGVATGLVKYVLETTNRRGFSCCSLEVYKDNRPAICFYKKLGFEMLEDRGEKVLLSISLRP